MIRYISGFLGLFLFAGCASTNVNIKVWEHQPADSTARYFPERDDEVLAYPKIKNAHPDSTFGIAFSGGGTRSATATLGQLRALDSLGWIDKAHYISAVSGGNWTTVPYTYLPEKYSDKDFLGTYKEPGLLTLADITKTPDNYHGSQIANSYLVGSYLKGAVSLKGDEIYTYSIGQIFLKPYKLNSKDKFFTTTDRARKDIINRNSRELKDHFFYIIEKPNRPYPIINAVILDKLSFFEFKRSPGDIHPLEITPLYTGVPSLPKYYNYKTSEYYKGKNIFGGGYIETYGYDTHLEEINSNGTARVKLKRKRNYFTLNDAIGTSGAAPQKVLTGPLSKEIGWLSLVSGAGLFFTGLPLAAKLPLQITLFTVGLTGLNIAGFPEYHHWPLYETKVDVSKKDYDHGDGGNIENIGLMPLLARQVKNILVFVNTPTPFRTGSEDIIDGEVISDDLISFFRTSSSEPFNKVFVEDELRVLYKALEARKVKGLPLVYCQNYSIKSNQKFNIQPYEADICWVYLDRTEYWLEELSDNQNLNTDTVGKRYKELVLKRDKEFVNFPHYNTFFPINPKIRYESPIKLSPGQVNLMSNLTAWTLFEEKEYLRNHLLK